eukprot:1160850-Pelagomonas_calceolata.AAC.6
MQPCAASRGREPILTYGLLQADGLPEGAPHQRTHFDVWASPSGWSARGSSAPASSQSSRKVEEHGKKVAGAAAARQPPPPLGLWAGLDFCWEGSRELGRPGRQGHGRASEEVSKDEVSPQMKR